MIRITGLGPGDFDRNPGPVRDLLLDRANQLIIRTRSHPAAVQLASQRDDIVFCDDLYESGRSFEEVYSAIADRVLAAAVHGPVIYAVPGGPGIGEFAVRQIMSRTSDVEVIATETFVDALLADVGYDPFDRGLQILNGHRLADPIVLDKPTIVGHLDRPEILADVAARLSRVLPEGARVVVFAGIGAGDFTRWEGPIDEVESSYAGLRTSMWVDSEPGGLIGAVRTMKRLRDECPWDREQTHKSLAKNLIEESYELIDAIGELGDGEIDFVAYSGIEEEVGDVLLQVLFHSAIAKEAGAFDIDDAAEVLRQKLVRRHPHVFGEVVVADADEVKANWDRIKQDEKGGGQASALDGVPADMPALYLAAKLQNRAAKWGLDWTGGQDIFARLRQELDILPAVFEDSAAMESPLGDLLFSVVGLAHDAGVDPELALRHAARKFEERFRKLEQEAALETLSVSEPMQLGEVAGGQDQ